MFRASFRHSFNLPEPAIYNQAQSPLGHLDWYVQNGRLRDDDLAPDGSPLQAAERLLASDRWKRLVSGSGGDEVHFIRRQLIAALKPVLPFPEGQRLTEAAWQQWSQAVSRLNPRWDPARQCFAPSP